MPEVEIILSIKPEDLNFLKYVDYPLGFFEKFAQSMNIQMQFEITADRVLVFLKTRADLEKILQFLNQVSLARNPTFSPSESKRAWVFTVLKAGTEGQAALLQNLAEKCRSFVGNFGRVELSDHKVVLFLPENFHLHTYFSSAHPLRKKEKNVKQPAKH